MKGGERGRGGPPGNGREGVCPMPGDGVCRCPRCGRVGRGEDFGVAPGGGKTAARCPDCGREIPF